MTYEFAGGYKIRDQFGLYFMTFTVVGWVDIFSRQVYRDIFIKNMEYCRKNKDLLIGAYVIMTNHVHVIWQSKTGKLSDTLRDFKSYCTKEMIGAMNMRTESRREWLLHLFRAEAAKNSQNKEFRIWKMGSHPVELITERMMRTRLNYIHDNPVRVGWVKRQEDYVYSSAANYITGKGFIEIDYLF